MPATFRRLFDLCARDLMSQSVLCISQETSVRAAAHQLAQANVTGAPVLDQRGRCVGVFSQTDIVRFLDGVQAQLLGQPGSEQDYFADWQVFDLDALPGESVSGCMTRQVVTALPDATVGDLSRMMHDARIHRIVIVDDNDHVVGIVSSMDILAAVAAESAIADGD